MIPNRVSEVVLPSSILVPERMVSMKNFVEKYFNGFSVIENYSLGSSSG